ncbi:MAG: hypothetical protein HC859_15095, partial [Bacteroidia bacterium]|nr:hypothetical protein [Bacteroidia bacterium]
MDNNPSIHRRKVTVGLLTTFLILAFAHTNLFAQQVAKVTSTTNSIGYWEYLPPGYNSNTDKYPIVFFMHGIGERGDGTTQIGKVTANGPPKFAKNGYQFPFILISPQLKSSYGTWPAWYIDEVVEYCKTYLRIDESRIYITGLSLGGGGAWVYAQAYASKIAALAPVCGGYNSPSQACNIVNSQVPTWAFHGDADPTVNINKTTNMINAMLACNPAPNPAPIYTIYPGVKHNAWDYAYRT